jgi:hypothetical protein
LTRTLAEAVSEAFSLSATVNLNARFVSADTLEGAVNSYSSISLLNPLISTYME